MDSIIATISVDKLDDIRCEYNSILIQDNSNRIRIKGSDVVEKISHDHLIELDSKEFKNFIKKIEEERNE